MRVYLLPRYEYSVTTWKHVYAFIQDYCSFVRDYNAREMRKIAALGVEDDEKEYAFAKGIVEERNNLAFCKRLRRGMQP